ncbi:SusD/RagB family nutrient-binding outer membrane lipoprotein [Maribacter sp. CXY002]|uniref:SusD/RagB family nutrient-binding outer membrane lipoprotein n=1 Tax=Maribacter luteocoastalis TaxID=3407671 RepID=UPI003B684001
MSPSGEYVSDGLFYGTDSELPTGPATAQVAKWRKLGNSLLLRLGIRYPKVNPSTVTSMVSEAFSGGVMSSNEDNVYVKYDGNVYMWNDNCGLRDSSFFN